MSPPKIYRVEIVCLAEVRCPGDTSCSRSSSQGRQERCTGIAIMAAKR